MKLIGSILLSKVWTKQISCLLQYQHGMNKNTHSKTRFYNKILSKYTLLKDTFKIYTSEGYFQSIHFRNILSIHTLQNDTFRAYTSEKQFQSIHFRFRKTLSKYKLQKLTLKVYTSKRYFQFIHFRKTLSKLHFQKHSRQIWHFMKIHLRNNIRKFLTYLIVIIFPVYSKEQSRPACCSPCLD